jgi:hypothetical protein
MKCVDQSQPMKHAEHTKTMLLLALALLAAAPPALLALDAMAADAIPVQLDQPLRDPWVPPESRKASKAAPTEGAALRAQVERKLKLAFDAADVNHSGSLTRQQASAAGLGFVTQHFDEIDRQKSGSVRFDDVKRFLVARGAQLD